MFTECYSMKYKGNTDKNASFNLPTVLTANLTHVRKSRYRLKWRMVNPSSRYGHQYITLNMICR